MEKNYSYISFVFLSVVCITANAQSDHYSFQTSIGARVAGAVGLSFDIDSPVSVDSEFLVSVLLENTSSRELQFTSVDAESTEISAGYSNQVVLPGESGILQIRVRPDRKKNRRESASYTVWLDSTSGRTAITLRVRFDDVVNFVQHSALLIVGEKDVASAKFRISASQLPNKLQCKATGDLSLLKVKVDDSDVFTAVVEIDSRKLHHGFNSGSLVLYVGDTTLGDLNLRVLKSPNIEVFPNSLNLSQLEDESLRGQFVVKADKIPLSAHIGISGQSAFRLGRTSITRLSETAHRVMIDCDAESIAQLNRDQRSELRLRIEFVGGSSAEFVRPLEHVVYPKRKSRPSQK